MENINLTILRFGKEYQGILKLVGAVISFLLAFGTLIHLFNVSGFFGLSGYPAFSEVLYEICLILGILAMLGGFGLLGAMLLMKPKHILTTIAIALIALGEFLNCMENFFYYIWQSAYIYSYIFSYPYIPMLFLSLLAAVAWAFPAAAAYLKNKNAFRNITLVFLIIPGALLILHILISAITGAFGVTGFFYNLLEMALLAVVGILVLSCNDRPAMDSIREMNAKNAEQRWQDAKKTQPGQTAHSAYDRPQDQQKQAPQNSAPQPKSVPAEGYIGIVELVIFSIITLGIYVYIWIYKTSKFLDRRLNRQGSFSPGVEVVLCLFIPFYFIYWVYKQTKAAETAHKMVGNPGSDDLAIINILLCVFGLGIVAYALLQDQINKLCTGYTAPPRYDRPQNINTNDYNFDPMTGEPVRKAPQSGYNFDPITGEPIRKETPAQSEIFEEIPIAQESAEIVEEPAPEVLKEATEEPAPEVLEEVTEETAPEVLEEVTEETAPEVLEEVTEEPIEETAKEAPAEAAEETPEEPAVPTEEQEENIRMLQRLLDAGVLTREEFEAKKNDILKA